MPRRHPRWIGSVAVVTMLVGGTAAGADLPPPAPVEVVPDARQTADEAVPGFVERFGASAYVIAPGLMIVVAILPIPAEFPAALNGMLFGPAVGTLITWFGAIVGAVISFELARRFGRPLAERFVAPGLIDRADRVVQSAGWPGLLFLRLVPVFAFTAINWGSGLTRMGRWTFFWTTAIGILPGAIVFTSSGSGLAALYRTHPVIAMGLGVTGLVVLWWTIARYRRCSGARITTGEPATTPPLGRADG